MAQWVRPLWAASDEYKYISCSPLTVRSCPTGSLCAQLTLCRNREDALDYYFADLDFKWIFQSFKGPLGYGGIAVLKVSTIGVSNICLAPTCNH